MTSGSDVRRVSSSGGVDIETVFNGLRPGASYVISVAVNMSYVLGPAVYVAATTTSEFFNLRHPASLEA